MKMMAKLKDTFYWNLVYEDRYQLILEGLKITLLLCLSAFVLGSLLGGLFCMAKRSRHGWLRVPVRLFTSLMTKLPPLLMLMIFAYMILVQTGLTPVAIAIVAFTLKCASHLSDMFVAAVASVSPGEVEAARTLGYSKWQAFRQVVLPQAFRQVLPLYRTQFVLTMQDTSVVSLLAIQDMTRSVNIITSRTLDPILALVLVAIVYLLLGSVITKVAFPSDKIKHFTREEGEKCR